MCICEGMRASDLWAYRKIVAPGKPTTQVSPRARDGAPGAGLGPFSFPLLCPKLVVADVEVKKMRD